MRNFRGKVYLIGAGPGDPDLITVKGLHLLRECDVVLYDSLIPDEIIVTLPAGVEAVYVGKRGGKHSLPQPEINELMLKYAAAGKVVGRLKGSDPLIFGRGGEEALFLREHGIDFEIVPGVTAGIAAPTYAGIPCTDRNRSSFLLMLTGHKAAEKSGQSAPWDWVAKAKGGTLVIYMGVGEIRGIVGELIASGMSPDMPSAVIERGTFPTQRSFVSSLSELPDVVERESIKAPAIFVIGDVVDLKPQLEWLKDRPLLGRRVMVTRPADQARETYKILRDLGAEVLPYPTITITEAHDIEAWNRFDRIENETRWLVFTSENGVQFFMQQFLDRCEDIRELSSFRIAAVGSGTARALARYHVKPDFIPSEATVSILADEFLRREDLSGSTLVRIRGNLGDSTIENAAKKAGAKVLPLHVYRTDHYKWPDHFRDKLFEFPPDAIMFTSSSTFDGFLGNLDSAQTADLLNKCAICSIGPSTTATIKSGGFAVSVESGEHTTKDLISKITAFFQVK
jgi:uroporphyrinogen III methyltransferase/synthase